MCRPKSEGGLGLRRLKDWNMACLARIVWMLFGGKETLWIDWVKVNLLKGRSFWIVKPCAQSSWCWKKILKLKSLVKPMIVYELGNGKTLA